MIKLFRSKKKLLNELATLENKVIEREHKVFFEEKMALITEYESKIISEAQKAADERELKMMEIIEAKDARIKELELEIIALKNSYRGFKEDIQEHEVIIDVVNTAMQSAMTVLNQLAGKFEGLKFQMGKAIKKIEKKDTKLIEEGKS